MDRCILDSLGCFSDSRNDHNDCFSGIMLNASHHLLGDGAFIFFSRYKIISQGWRVETLLHTFQLMSSFETL